MKTILIIATSCWGTLLLQAIWHHFEGDWRAVPVAIPFLLFGWILWVGFKYIDK